MSAVTRLLPPHASVLWVAAESGGGCPGVQLPECELTRLSWREFLALSPAGKTDSSGFAGIVLDAEALEAPPLVLLAHGHRHLRDGGVLLIRKVLNTGSETAEQGRAAGRVFYLGKLAAHCGFSPCAGSEPWNSRFGLAVRKSAEGRWRLAQPEVSDEEGCRSLFQSVFGTAISPELWRWKYGEGRGRSMLARRGDKIVAHYGGSIRRISFLGEEALALQICDVMVEPRERALMTKTGAFFEVVSAFIETYFGYYQDYLVGYGFPNRRHLQLAEKMGFYAEVERITELSWAPLPARPRIATNVRPFDPGRDGDAVLARLWAEMQRDLAGAILVVRDPEYLRYRYRQHPHQRYEFLLVGDRLTGRPRGVLVLRRDPEECKLMDIVAPLRAIPRLVDHARRQVARWGLPKLTAWISSQKTHVFAGTEARETVTDISIPTNVWTEGPSLARVRNRWWLMMGDTDFL